MKPSGRAVVSTASPDAADELLIQRVVWHVAEAAATGKLPYLPWRLGLSEAQQRAVRARWPLSVALWEDVDQRAMHCAKAILSDTTELLNPLRELLMVHRADAAAPFWVNGWDVTDCARQSAPTAKTTRFASEPWTRRAETYGR